MPLFPSRPQDVRVDVAGGILRSLKRTKGFPKELLDPGQWPPILLTDEEPPKGEPSIDTLGSYDPDSRSIKLFLRSIFEKSKDSSASSSLALVVAIHELGHWVSHIATVEKSHEWPLELFKTAPPIIKETWAQLFTQAVVDSAPELKDVFEWLDKNQPYPYRVFHSCPSWVKKNGTVSLVKIIASLPELRKLHWPAYPEQDDNSSARRSPGKDRMSKGEPADWVDQQHMGRWEEIIGTAEAKWPLDWSNLHHAVGQNNFDWVKEMLAAGACVNAQDEEKKTPFQTAVACPTVDDKLLDILLEKALELETPDIQVRVDWACEEKKEFVHRWIMETSSEKAARGILPLMD